MIRIGSSKRDNIITDLMPDLTPLLDVVFMLIVFLILTANAVPYALDIDLPTDKEAVSQAIEDTDTISIVLLPGEQGWKIGERGFDSEESFKTALRERHQSNPDRKVIIIGEKTVSMEKLLDLLAFLRAQNIPTADIVMERR